jgi:CheY-like chemotaxis protein
MLDLKMPTMNGIDATREIKVKYPGVKVDSNINLYALLKFHFQFNCGTVPCLY